MRSVAGRRLVVAGLLLALAGCSGAGSAAPRPSPSAAPPTTSAAALTAAITTYQSSRSAALADVAPVARAAAVLDGADADAIKGSLAKGRSAIPGATGPVQAGKAALAALSGHTDAYAAAVTAVTATESTPGLTGPQLQSLTALVTAAQGEVTALRRFATTQKAGWMAYDDLQTTLALWLMRAIRGDYANQSTLAYDTGVAGSAYQALSHPLRPSLATERASLGGGTTTLAAAQKATDSALDAARTAFA